MNFINETGTYTVKIESVDSEEASSLLEELSRELEHITGCSGNSSFDISDIDDTRAVFAIARNQWGEAVGCGAIRPLNEHTAEIKRVYSRIKKAGIGKGIVCFLEAQAKALGYKSVCLETRIVNQNAFAFYKKLGYKVILNYGKYFNRSEAVCFEKKI